MSSASTKRMKREAIRYFTYFSLSTTDTKPLKEGIHNMKRQTPPLTYTLTTLGTS